MKILTWLIIMAVTVCSPWPMWAEDPKRQNEFRIFGDCSVIGSGTLFLFLVDSTQFKNAQTGYRTFIREVRAKPNELSRISFSFQVPQGRYGLRCFVDTNDNGLLDKGLFGPAEPWGMSWQGTRPMGFPRFSDISFAVEADFQCPLIEIK